MGRVSPLAPAALARQSAGANKSGNDMSLFGKLFGSKGAGAGKEVKPELYEGFRIYPEPIREAGGYRINARIEKDVGGMLRSHQMVRADVVSSEDEAREITLRKAQSFIDQMGERIFS